ncbi:MAG: hypothetical protein II787_02845 [Lachnospiraceae bacterium]|nr:hypothetical protein [Lachnospiraceae bacterium]
MVKGLIVILYLYGLLPLLLGAGACSLAGMCPQGGSAQGRLFSVRPFRLPGGFASCCVTGWVIELALMRLMTAAAAPDASHAAFALRWGIVCIGAGLAGLGITVFGLAQRRRGQSTGFAGSGSQEPHSRLIPVSAVVLILFSILFTVPHLKDMIPELSRLTLASDRFFSVNPANGASYDGAAHLPAGLHLLYTTGAALSGIDVTVLIHVIMPVFLLTFFFCTYIEAGRVLLAASGSSDAGRTDSQDNPELTNTSPARVFFFMSAAVIYLIFTLTPVHIGLAVYRNIWNPATLGASCLYPLFFIWCLELASSKAGRHGKSRGLNTDGHSRNTRLTVPGIILRILRLVLTIAALTLCFTYALVPCALVATAALLIALARLFLGKGGERA